MAPLYPNGLASPRVKDSHTVRLALDTRKKTETSSSGPLKQHLHVAALDIFSPNGSQSPREKSYISCCPTPICLTPKCGVCPNPRGLRHFCGRLLKNPREPLQNTGEISPGRSVVNPGACEHKSPPRRKIAKFRESEKRERNESAQSW